jgi:hypothetical protein
LLFDNAAAGIRLRFHLLVSAVAAATAQVALLTKRHGCCQPKHVPANQRQPIPDWPISVDPMALIMKINDFQLNYA